MGTMTAARPPPSLWLRCFPRVQELLLRRRIVAVILR